MFLLLSLNHSPPPPPISQSSPTNSPPPPPLFQVCLHNRYHYHLRIHDLIATPPTNNAIPHHAQTLFPTNSTRIEANQGKSEAEEFDNGKEPIEVEIEIFTTVADYDNVASSCGFEFECWMRMMTIVGEELIMAGM